MTEHDLFEFISIFVCRLVMSLEDNTPEILKHGTRWLRADFHLHTKADKEFTYTGEENRFVSDYITGLKRAGIRVGAITSHNKFDVAEFKALRKKARKEDICLLPGVELSVAEVWLKNLPRLSASWERS